MQAYAAGCNIVILASDFQRVQIIPSAHGDAGVDLQVSCISCCSDDGKVLWHISQSFHPPSCRQHSLVGNSLVLIKLIDKIALHWASLALGWVTVFCGHTSVLNQPYRPTQPATLSETGNAYDNCFGS